MRQEMLSKTILVISLLISMFCGPSPKSGDKTTMEQNKNHDVDSASYVFRTVHDSAIKKFYYDLFVTTPWFSGGVARPPIIDTIEKNPSLTIPTLIQLVGDYNDSIRVVAWIFLSQATKQQFGNPKMIAKADRSQIDSVQSAWLSWWNKTQSTQ